MKLEIVLKLGALLIMTIAVERLFSANARGLLLMLLAAVLLYLSSRRTTRRAG